MTYVVGYGPHENDRGAIELACQLARSAPQPVVAVSVIPRGWGTPAAAGTDREFAHWAETVGADSAALAAADLARHPEIDGSAVWVPGRSVPQTLLEQAEARDAEILVVASSGDAEPGRIRLTSKTDRLLHSSTVPVAIAPRDYQTSSGVARVTVGFRDDDRSWSLLTRVAEICRRSSAKLRVVTFLVSPVRRPVTSDVSHAETQVIDLWATQAASAQAEAAAHLSSMGFTPENLEVTTAGGPDWGAAIGSIDWADGDLLVLGSSSTHRLAQVFLGSSASKIVRHAPVPVVIVPGSPGH
ncbi:universal stress protein [Microbacterium aoyamense]|uniref:Universal stress protein n=1 Tax=Microbacterium aoyamense TaxID=344166 RepID=A0ABN2PFL5_9MICO|nr:universal stress protein [Microbacterium aoyamense]